MRSLKRLLAPTAIALSLALGGCANGAFNQTPTMQMQALQANTLAEAINLDTVAARAVTVYVQTGNPNRATLIQLQTDARIVHDALVTLEQANAAGMNLNFTVVNAAYRAFYDYAIGHGVTL